MIRRNIHALLIAKLWDWGASVTARDHVLRAKREIGGEPDDIYIYHNWWGFRISVSCLSLNGYEKQTLGWQVGEIAQLPRWAIWHFRVITRCTWYFATETVSSKPLLFLTISEGPSKASIRPRKPMQYYVSDPNLEFQAQSLCNLKHGISHMYSTWHCTHARMHASAFRRDKYIWRYSCR